MPRTLAEAGCGFSTASWGHAALLLGCGEGGGGGKGRNLRAGTHADAPHTHVQRGCAQAHTHTCVHTHTRACTRTAAGRWAASAPASFPGRRDRLNSPNAQAVLPVRGSVTAAAPRGGFIVDKPVPAPVNSACLHFG